MKGKIVLLVGMIVLVGVVVFVLAEQVDQGDMIISLHISQGWNLVSSGTFAVNPSQDSEIKIKDISAIYYYNPLMKKYRRVHPNSEIAENELLAYYEGTNIPAAWIYSEKSGNLVFKADDVLPLEERPIYKGWNFVSITPGVTKMFFEKKLGDCDIEKSYYFDAYNQDWVNYPVSNLFEEIDGPYDEDFIGLGWVIKVLEDCNLGSSTSGAGPPGLPGEIEGCTDSDGGLDYNTKGKLCDLNGDCTYDFCEEDRLTEYYCDTPSDADLTYHTCPNGCQDGACIQ